MFTRWRFLFSYLPGIALICIGLLVIDRDWSGRLRAPQLAAVFLGVFVIAFGTVLAEKKQTVRGRSQAAEA